VNIFELYNNPNYPYHLEQIIGKATYNTDIVLLAEFHILKAEVRRLDSKGVRSLLLDVDWCNSALVRDSFVLGWLVVIRILSTMKAG
jgi:hypothetical protein